MTNFRRRGFLLWFVFAVILGFAPGVASGISAAAAKSIQIVALGDSLTAGLGVERQFAYPAQLEAALRAKGFDVTITNAGVSGDTSTGGLARLDWAVPDSAKIVIVELGANDALRGLDPAITRKSLSQIVARLKARGKVVVLAGMLAPPNLGADYGRKFAAIYEELGRQEGVWFYRFFLDGVAADPALNQPDGLHPTAKGYKVLVERFLPFMLKVLKQSGQ